MEGVSVATPTTSIRGMPVTVVDPISFIPPGSSTPIPFSRTDPIILRNFPNFAFAHPIPERSPFATHQTTRRPTTHWPPFSFIPPQSTPPLFQSPPPVVEPPSSSFPPQSAPPLLQSPPPFSGSARGNVESSTPYVNQGQHPEANVGTTSNDSSTVTVPRKRRAGANAETDGKSKHKQSKRTRNSTKSNLSLPLDGDRETVERTLAMFEGVRRRLMQLRKHDSGTKAGSMLMAAGHRTNQRKRIGSIPGVEVGDMFYFRIEMCLVGLHSQSMAGIDYMAEKFDQDEESVAISIVSSGKYDDKVDRTDELIYTGEGGSSKPGKQVGDQKLERGNLALENSYERGNEIRVIRGMKDSASPNGKIYVYDGLYKIQEKWIEKKDGFNVFMYRLGRIPGQPDGMGTWKFTQKWRENPSSRSNVIVHDISCGAEKIPICLVNDVDNEKGPIPFIYSTSVRYLKDLHAPTTPATCRQCYRECILSDPTCICAQMNGGDHPYTSNGLLVSHKRLIYECGSSCSCSLRCPNRVGQLGVRLHLEVFKTRDRGWGLRSWDAIRAGAFVCEFIGNVLDMGKMCDRDEEDEYIFRSVHEEFIGNVLDMGKMCDRDEEDEYIFRSVHESQNSEEWNYPPELLGEEGPATAGDGSEPLPIIINAKNVGSASRFINHSCSPNLLWQRVLYDHCDQRLPHIMFYARKNIPPMTELTYDYGLISSEPRTRKQCRCGSSKCRGFFG